MKRFLPFIVLALLGARPQDRVPGIAQPDVNMHPGYEVQLRYYSVPPIAASFFSRNRTIATVDPKTGLVHGVTPGVTWVLGRVFGGHCMMTDSVKVTVLRRR